MSVTHDVLRYIYAWHGRVELRNLAIDLYGTANDVTMALAANILVAMEANDLIRKQDGVWTPVVHTLRPT